MAIEYTIHPAAEVFPLLPEEQLAALAEDIRANGLRDPIVRMGDVILDGRNRWEACRRANVVPQFREIQVADPVAYIVSTNLHRRHLTIRERADIAAKLTTLKHGTNRYAQKVDGQNCPSTDEPPPVSIKQAATLLGVSAMSVKSAKKRQRENAGANEVAPPVEKAPDPDPTPEQQQRIDKLAAELDRKLSRLALLTAQNEAGEQRDKAYWSTDPAGQAIRSYTELVMALKQVEAITRRPDLPPDIPAALADQSRDALRAIVAFYYQHGVSL